MSEGALDARGYVAVESAWGLMRMNAKAVWSGGLVVWWSGGNLLAN